MSDFFNTLWKHDRQLRAGDSITINFGVSTLAGHVEQDQSGALNIRVGDNIFCTIMYKCYDKTQVPGLLGAYYAMTASKQIVTLIPDVEKNHWFLGDYNAFLPSGTTYIHKDCAVIDEKHKIIWLQLARNASSSIVYHAAVANTDLTFPTHPGFCIWGHQQVLWDRGILCPVSTAAKLDGYRIVCVVQCDPWARWLSGVGIVQHGYSYPYLCAANQWIYRDNSPETFIRRAAIISRCCGRSNILVDPHLQPQCDNIDSWLSIYKTAGGQEKDPEVTYVELAHLNDWFQKEFGEEMTHNNNKEPLPAFKSAIISDDVKQWVMEHHLKNDVQRIKELDEKGLIL